MSEGPETERKRRELRAERERLEQGMDIIVNLEASSTSPVAQTAGYMYGGSTFSRVQSMAGAPTVMTSSEYGDT
jgi:hypothetical protein